MFKKTNSTFVVQDEQILNKYFSLKSCKQGEISGIKNMLFFFLKQMIFLAKNLNRHSIILVWFADYQSLIPSIVSKLFGTKCFIIIGGFDAAKRPDLNYGGHLHKIRSWFIRKSIKNSTGILPVSKFTEREILDKLSFRPKSKIIYNGIPLSQFNTSNNRKRKNQIVIICGASEKNRIKIKGVDFFIKLAKKLPEYQFVVIGIKDEIANELNLKNTDNLTIKNWMTRDEIKTTLNESKIICQFSRYEAFGLALVEGMVSGCVPIIYDYGGSSELINNDFGISINSLDLNVGAAAIEKGIKGFDKLSPLAITHASNNFSLHKRENELISFLKSN